MAIAATGEACANFSFSKSLKIVFGETVGRTFITAPSILISGFSSHMETPNVKWTP